MGARSRAGSRARAPRLYAAYAASWTRCGDDPSTEVRTCYRDWQELVAGLCAKWFPAQDYPTWTGPLMHPADAFVAGCLIWRPQGVPEEWVRHFALRVCGTTHDPAAPGRHPDSEYQRAVHEGTLAALAAAIDAGLPTTRERLCRIEADAIDAALAERALHPTEPSWFVPVFEGLTSTDLRDAEPRILDALRDRRRERARRLCADGRSLSAIGRDLGVDRRTVRRWINAP